MTINETDVRTVHHLRGEIDRLNAELVEAQKRFESLCISNARQSDLLRKCVEAVRLGPVEDGSYSEADVPKIVADELAALWHIAEAADRK